MPDTKAPKAATDPEQAVREYLLYVGDPRQLIDLAAVESLQDKVREAADPIERLTLRAQLKAAAEPPAERIEAAFIAHAGEWCEANAVPGEVFLDESVPREVLERAGLLKRRASTATATAEAPKRRRQRTRVTAEQVQAAIPDEPFSVQELAERAGASGGTARKRVLDLVAAGELTELGPDPDHAGVGRAPVLYARAVKVSA
jgi:hypothetical protein